MTSLPPQSEPEVYIDRKECAARLGIGVSTLDRWVREKGLPVHHWGMRITRFKFSEVEAWLDSRG